MMNRRIALSVALGLLAGAAQAQIEPEEYSDLYYVINENEYFLETNTSTITCPNELIGSTFTIGAPSNMMDVGSPNADNIYTVVDRAMLDTYVKTEDLARLSRACVSNVTDMSGLFSERPINPDISRWDTSNVTSMKDMFSFNPTFNTPIAQWDVSQVKDMSGMFEAATNFNQPIGNWNVSNVTQMHGMFSRAERFNQPVGNWNVGLVTTMNSMFSYAPQFNQPIGKWNVSRVTDMSYMFYYATSFNQPIGNWDMSSVTTLEGMFQGATSFNQSVDEWDVSSVQDFRDVFTWSAHSGSVDGWNETSKIDINFLKSLINFSGVSSTPEGIISGATRQLQTEITKETQAIRSIQESIAAYGLQFQLKQDVANIHDILTRKPNSCVDTMQADKMVDIQRNVRQHEIDSSREFINRLSNRVPEGNQLVANYDYSLPRYCTPFDESLGRCKIADAKFESGDVMASTLLTSQGSGEGATESYVEGQREAAEDYINRIIGVSAMPIALPYNCPTAQCAAYEELRKRYYSNIDSARNSLTAIMARRTAPADM